MVGPTPRQSSERPPYIRWGVAVASVVLALLANWTIPNGRFPAAVFVAAVIVTANLGGAWPAFFSFFPSAPLPAPFFSPPASSFYTSPLPLPPLCHLSV